MLRVGWNSSAMTRTDTQARQLSQAGRYAIDWLRRKPPWVRRSLSSAARSLGTLMVLDHIARARHMGLAYVYLGYWVRGSRKMDYKSRFLPQERLTPDGWARVR